ncbi:MAG TPA: hypothetical protein VF815_46995 [Myxococcaceae bacterium]|jgi:hypothetical protein
MERETLPDGSLRLREGGCTHTYTRLRPGVMLVRITGYDRGELVSVAFEPLNAELSVRAPLALLVDVTGAEGAAKPASDAWTEWFRTRKPQLQEVHVLVTSKYLDFIVNVAKHFSRTGELIQVYSDAGRFEANAARLVPGLKRLPAPE